MASKYERIRYEANGGRGTVILRDPTTIQFMGEPALTGTEVNREGEEVAGRGFDERQRIIQTECIVKRTPLVWNNKYGTLVVAL
jgi:hypothetical protein